MNNDSKKGARREAFGPDTIEQYMRDQVRDKLGEIIEEEVMLSLGAGRYERVGEERLGYLHGTRRRDVDHQFGSDNVRYAAGSAEDGGRGHNRMVEPNHASLSTADPSDR